MLEALPARHGEGCERQRGLHPEGDHSLSAGDFKLNVRGEALMSE